MIDTWSKVAQSLSAFWSWVTETLDIILFFQVLIVESDHKNDMLYSSPASMWHGHSGPRIHMFHFLNIFVVFFLMPYFGARYW